MSGDGARILYVHWNAPEARERAGILREAGHTVVLHTDLRAGAPTAARTRPPDVAVIDLRRIPSAGQAVGVWLRQQKPTRHVPLVFVEGDEEKTAKVRKLFPDATYTSWRGVRGAVTRARAAGAPPATAPDTMAGYSGTPLPRKLGIKGGHRLGLLGAPDGFRDTLGELPDGVRVVTRTSPGLDVALVFVRSAAELSRKFGGASKAVAPGGKLWIVWPKKASPLAGDLGGNEVRSFGLAAGWVDFKIAAVDADWSGLCFSRRRP